MLREALTRLQREERTLAAIVADVPELAQTLSPDDLATLDDPAQIEQTAVDRLGAYLGFDHLYFVKVDGHRASVLREYRRDVGGMAGMGGTGSIVGEYDLEEFFSPEALEQLARGESSVVGDVAEICAVHRSCRTSARASLKVGSGLGYQRTHSSTGPRSPASWLAHRVTRE